MKVDGWSVGVKGEGGTWRLLRSPLHFVLPAEPENPMDLQITAAAPELMPLLQIGTHALSIKISGRPFPSTEGDPSAAIKRTAPCGAPALSDAVQYTTVS